VQIRSKGGVDCGGGQLLLIYERTTAIHSPELSMGWVDPWVGLRFFSFWWVGSTVAKVLKIRKYCVNAIKARLDKISLHQAVIFDFTADLTGTGNRSEGVIKLIMLANDS